MDGLKVGLPEFIPISSDTCTDEKNWERLGDASRLLCDLITNKDNGSGLIGFIHSGSNNRVDDYINAWIAALKQSSPTLSLANTIEVQSLSGKTIGLIVLPSHPLRLAWHCAYDVLVQYAIYENSANPSRLVKTLQTLDGSYFPAFLPGFNSGESFVFGDTLGFYGVVMVRDKDKEPKLAIAQIAKALSAGVDEVAPSIGNTISTALSSEIYKYCQLHDKYRSYHIHALRPGDGMTVTKALGQTLKKSIPTDEESENQRQFGYILELYPSKEQIGRVGRFLTENTQKRRTGAGSISEEDRWLLDNYQMQGGIPLPKLRWAKRQQQEPSTPAHLSISFDAFDVQVVDISEENLPSYPLQVYGLVCHLTRKFEFEAESKPIWRTYISFNVEGEKHPAGRKYSDRILELHKVILEKVAINLDGVGNKIPVLETIISPSKEQSLKHLHEISDWVISIDRNAGVEYFDSPKVSQGIYNSYIIDCVPERQQMGQNPRGRFSRFTNTPISRFL
jgi:hypothetical protein